MCSTTPLRPRIGIAVGGVLVLIGLVWLLVMSSSESTGDAADAEDSPVVLPTPASAPTSAPALPAVDPSTTPTSGIALSPVPTVVTTPTAVVRLPGAAESSTLPPLGSMVVRELRTDDLGTGSAEFSAVALNEADQVLVIADDEGRLFEFDLDASGVPIVPPRRTFTVDFGNVDLEGIAWMSGSTYALSNEDTGTIIVISLDTEEAIDSKQALRTVNTRVPEDNGNGIEGVAYVRGDGDVEFVVVDERPPTIYLVHKSGDILQGGLLNNLIVDASDVWIGVDDSLLVLSDESRVIIEVELGSTTLPDPIASLDLVFDDGRFVQPEGVVRSIDGTRLYVVGESPGSGQYSFGYWVSE